MGIFSTKLKKYFSFFCLFISICLFFFLLSIESKAQISVSPDFKIPEIVVPEDENSEVKKSSQDEEEKQTTKGVALSSKQQEQTVDDPAANVVVSPTSIVTPIDQIGSSVSVITQKSIENNQWNTGPDALKYVPGVNVVQSGGVGSATSIFMRGTESNHTKVLIDGIDVSDPSNPGKFYDLGQLTTWDIDRIEVLRGPQSGLYGADALGGVISVTTKKGEGPPTVRASAEGGSFGTMNERASLSGSEKNFNYSVSIDHLRSTSIPVTPPYLIAPGQKRNNDSYDNWTYATKLGVSVTDNLTLNSVVRYTDSTTFYSDLTCCTPPIYAYSERSQRDYQQLVTRSEAVLTLFGGSMQNFFGIGYSDNQNSAVSPAYSSSNNGDRFKVDWRGVINLWKGQTLILGLEDQNETLNTTTYDIGFNEVPLNVSERDKAAYIEMQSEIFQRLFLVGNVRYDDNSNFGDATTWRFSLAYLVPQTETKLKGSVGTGFKAPSLVDRFVDYLPYYVANRNLEPEKNLGFDAGFEQPLLNNNVRFGATYFQNDLTDLIQLVCLLPSCEVTSLANVDSATTSGVETFLALKVSDYFTIRGDYTYTKAIDNETGQELLRRPENRGSVTALWLPTSRHKFSVTLLSVGSWNDLSRAGFGTVTQSGYTVVNLASDYKINDKVSLYGRIDNLFNTIYEEPNGYQHPGFGAYVGLRFAGP